MHGRFRNDKSTVAEGAVQKVREHILRIDPTARVVSSLLLLLAAASVNNSIRQGGLSAREMLLKGTSFKSTIAYIGPGDHITETPDWQCQSR